VGGKLKKNLRQKAVKRIDADTDGDVDTDDIENHQKTGSVCFLHQMERKKLKTKGKNLNNLIGRVNLEKVLPGT
jgi:hypothetical protein